MIIYFFVINLITFISFGIDKKKSIKKDYRISEFKLLLFSFIGGVIGSFLGMQFFHHKTRKIKFYIVNILSLLLYIIIFIYLL